MAKYNVKLLKKLASQVGLKLKLNFWETDSQNVYDFDVMGNSNIRRFKVVANKKDKKVFPDSANVYVGRSSKYGIRFKSHKELIQKIKNFEVK